MKTLTKSSNVLYGGALKYMNKQALKIFLQNKWVKIGIVLNFFILTILLLVILLNIKPTPTHSYIIYYTSLEGIKILGYFWNFYLLWFIGFFFSILHLSLAFILWFRVKKLSLFILANNILLNLFLFLAINAIIVINH